MRSMRICSQIVQARSVQAYAERGNDGRIKNINKNEENHRFSTLISSNLCLLLKGYCVYFTIPLFFIRLCLNATAPIFVGCYSSKAIEIDNLFEFYKLSYKTRTLDTLYQILLAEEVKNDKGRDNKHTRCVLNYDLIE